MDESESTVDESAGSVTRWIGELKAGDGKALQPIWERYYARLVQRPGPSLTASAQLNAGQRRGRHGPRARSTLYQGLREGRFPRLEDRDDLWRLLVHLTACKAVDRHRAKNRRKRGGGRS